MKYRCKTTPVFRKALAALSRMSRNQKDSATKRIDSQAAMSKAVKGVCNILRRDKAKGARLYVPELERGCESS